MDIKMEYFFTRWEDFKKALEKKKNALLLFDFDGTLTPIVSVPGKARLSLPVRKYIKTLSEKKRVEIGIISGRAIKDIMRLIRVRGIYYAGNHGLEIKSPGGLFIHPSSKKYSKYISRISSDLRRRLSGIKGAVLEDKALSLSLHYRLVEQKDVPKLKSEFMAACSPYIKRKAVKVSGGKKVLELRPPISWDKGRAAKMIEKLVGWKKALTVFVGDDQTDEDVFKVIKKGDFSIRVGKMKKSKARYFLRNPNEVRRLLMKITALLAIFFIVVSASTVYAGQKSSLSPFFTKEYRAKTEDEWEISLKRYILKNQPPQKCKAAVILCHGFNINNKFWDIDERSSLMRYLARNGYDVWAPSLRGSGMSSKPVLSDLRSVVKLDMKNIPGKLIKMPFNITKFDWTIDDHIHKDIPAIIDLVKEESGFDQVYWIGHSMGGIIMFAYLETGNRNDIAGFIPISSMMVIPNPLNAHLERIANQKALLTASLLINTTIASQLSNYTLGIVKSPIEELLMKKENMYDEVVFRFFRICIDDTAPGVVTQFSDSIKAGNMLSSGGGYNYTGNMRLIKVPILIMGGGDDGFVTKKCLRDSYDAVSSSDKSIAIFAKAQGYLTNYGHCDLVIGKNSEKEVYPVILNWLDERTVSLPEIRQ
ncbi:MAG: trehalose-phosphatase [Candidatus Omnitrophota bacterium]|nr:trehalose-phosphatase [Candidatus Omnitrophota bacterium]